MTHELYIDDILMDVDENTKVTMALRSNFLRDVSEITGNSTYTVQLPLTARNRGAIGASDVLAVSSFYPYLKHTARYIRDGVPIIENGVAVLVGVTDKIEILITWGINSNIARMFGDGLKLPELPITNWVEYTQTPSIPTWYGFRTGVPTSFLFYAHADYNDPLEDDEQWKTALDNAWVWQYKRPNVRLSWLISRIQNVYGVTISFPNSLEPFISRLAIPLIKDRAGDVGSDNITVTAWEQKPSGMLFSETNDAAGGVFSQETTPTQTLYVSVGKKVTIHYDIDINVTTAPPFDFVAAQPYMYAKVVNVLDGTQLSGYTANFKTKVDQFGTVSVSCHEDVDVEIPDMGYGLQLFVQANEQFVAAYIADKMVDASQVIKISPDAEHVQFGQHYPIAINLPDITIVDLLRALCVVTGTFPKQTQDNNLVLVPFQTLWDNIPNAEDWTRKVIPSYKEDRPQRVEFTVNGWSQQNLYKWKDIKDRTDNDQFNGEIDIESNTIDKVKTAYNSVFAVPRFNNSGVVRIPLYKINNYDAKAEDPTVPTTYEIKSYEDLLCSVTPYGLGQYASLSEDERPIMLSNEGLRLQDIINERYGRLIGALNQAKIITERFRLHDWDVKEFNETTPIYLQQYGRYFAVLDIEANADGEATVKMFDLGAMKAEPTPILPYDAEIEYLESSGTQYIETGITPNSETGLEAHARYANSGDAYCIGLRNDTSNTRWGVGRSSTGFYWCYGSYQQSGRLSGTYEASLQLNYLNNKKFIANDVGSSASSTANLPTLSFTPAYNIRLFGSAGVTASYSAFTGRIYSCKISQGNEIVMDLIPVRVGSVGYMYDRVTGRLFGNSGTGSFILGNDIL